MSNPSRLIAEMYLENVKESGRDNLRAACPFHKSSSARRSLYLFTTTGGWTCFGCGAGGTIPSLLYRLGLTREGVERVLKGVGYTGKAQAAIGRAALARDKSQSWDILPEWILGAWDWCPNRMLFWGFSEEIIREFEVGYDEARGRITFPIRDHMGRLVGVSGRAEPGGFPRYKVYDADPKTGELRDIVQSYTANNRLHLYGFDRFFAKRLMAPEGDHPPFVLVEGYKGAMWMAQQGLTHTAALQGSSLTAHQEQVAGMVRGEKYVLMDNEPGKSFPDDSGRCAAYKITERLSRYGRTFVCQYPEGTPIGTSPDDLTKDQLLALVKDSKTAAQAALQRSGRIEGRSYYRRKRT
jgi:DNA primase